MAKTLLLLVAVATFWSAAHAVVASNRRIVCYFDGAALRRPDPKRMLVSEIEPSLTYCTHLIYGYATIDTDSYKAVPRYQDDTSKYTSLVALKERFPSLKVLLSIGGGGADADQRKKYFELLESDEHRRTFVDSVKELLQQNRFDGIDIAWEFPFSKEKKDRGALGNVWHGVKKVLGYAHSHRDENPDEHRRQFSALIRELKSSLKTQNALLTLSVIPYINHSLYYDCAALSPEIDQLHLLAYDYHSPTRTPKKADYPAPLYRAGERCADLTVDGNVRWFLEKGFPSRKIILGIPTFARTWKLTKDSRITGVPPIDADGPGVAGSIANISGLLAYQTVCTLLPNDANAAYRTTLRRVTDPTDRLGSYGFRLPTREVSGLWVGYENQHSAEYKAAYARKKSLGGIAFSDLSLDDYNGVCTGEKFPIVRAGTLKLLSTSV
ncbi:chitinase-like protein Idgf4 isoform X1 [Schistocerca americana]|uniref:chitinase-like protein Idgf4 isoform X1 n=1 Tax=Schistocerca americana TaxID=7009 RepID=UPI001F4FB432|nr:chitinase-like protein Idgf4 isoform X1 [Schistocerca americana]